MKLSKLFFLFALAIAAVSCSSDDDNNNVYAFNQANLTGTYNVVYFQSKEVETVDVNGFDVITTTTSVGDTFNMNIIFASNNQGTIDGTYRVTETVTQGNQTNTDTYIIDLDNEPISYTVNAAASQIIIDGMLYAVSNWSPTGFTVKHEETVVEPNGDNTVYNEEIRFTK
ncbi:MAG: hypothetical protein CL526_04420 [Aequorivita sp.]|nr:hypothetical protein [Aequorivita sp.]|tara:strand:+ start:6289 stop:6798 length:510 start_codon:yes stop_codon:yes gene_type:complete